MQMKDIINHTPAKIRRWKGKDHYSYEAVFPDKYSIEGKGAPTKEEAKENFIKAWNDGDMTINGRFLKKFYPYWG